MKANVLNLEGKKEGTVDLPDLFLTDYRPDLIKRAVLAARANRRQKYGSDKMAGNRTSAHYHGLTSKDPSQKMMQRDMARIPREHGDTARFMRGRLVPQTVGGRRAHPPKTERNWSKKINKKERLLAIRSAIAATNKKDIVKKRNHLFDCELPIVIIDSVESIKKPKEVIEMMKKIGLEDEIKRTKEKKKRSGKSKLRRGKKKNKIGPLIVIKDDKGIVNACKNIQGMEAIKLKELNSELLSPGAHGIRLTIWSKTAFEELKKYNK